MKPMPDPFRAGHIRLMGRKKPADTLRADVTLVAGAGLSMASFWQRMDDTAEAAGDLFRSLLPDEKADRLSGLSVRCIGFGDLYMDSAALFSSPAYLLPAQADEMSAFCRSVPAQGGSSPKKSALEALCCAIQGPWSRPDGEVRHIVVLVTDCAAHLPEEPLRRVDAGYAMQLAGHLPPNPAPMPGTMEEMRLMWRDGVRHIDNLNSRLLIFAPPAQPWSRLTPWPRTTLRTLPAPEIRALPPEALWAEIAALC